MPGIIDQLPEFEPSKNYFVTGETLNQIIAAIRENQILEVRGAQIERTEEGLRIKLP